MMSASQLFILCCNIYIYKTITIIVLYSCTQVCQDRIYITCALYEKKKWCLYHGDIKIQHCPFMLSWSIIIAIPYLLHTYAIEFFLFF